MANKVYPKFGEALLNGQVGDLRSADLRLILCSSLYSYGAEHEFLSDITDTAAVRVAEAPSALLSPATLNGALDHADFTFSTLSGVTVSSVILIAYNASDALARLIFFMDTNAAGDPISKSPTGGDFTVTVNPLGWFRIGG